MANKNLSGFSIITRDDSRNGGVIYYVTENNHIVAGGFYTRPIIETQSINGVDRVVCIVPSLSGNDPITYIL